uniref:HIT-type domain-containing protein n=1 Tax=Rhabditophanes sp. KR3021 TaxID=114890 RepID=A0AC35UEG8_9BILA
MYRQSNRIAKQDSNKRVNVEERSRRLKKKLDDLEKDNLHSDPFAGLIVNPKRPKFEEEVEVDAQGRIVRNKEAVAIEKKKQKFRDFYFKHRNRKSFLDTVRDQYTDHIRGQTPLPKRYEGIYFKVVSGEPKDLQRKFCQPCGFLGKYTCTKCGTPFCSINCRDIHNDTRFVLLLF